MEPQKKRIAWSGGTLATNKPDAIRRFLARKRDKGEKLTPEQLKLLDASARMQRKDDVIFFNCGTSPRSGRHTNKFSNVHTEFPDADEARRTLSGEDDALRIQKKLQALAAQRARKKVIKLGKVKRGTKVVKAQPVAKPISVAKPVTIVKETKVVKQESKQPSALEKQKQAREQLRELKGLLMEELITQDDYQKEKQKVLDFLSASLSHRTPSKGISITHRTGDAAGGKE